VKAVGWVNGVRPGNALHFSTGAEAELSSAFHWNRLAAIVWNSEFWPPAQTSPACPGRFTLQQVDTDSVRRIGARHQLSPGNLPSLSAQTRAQQFSGECRASACIRTAWGRLHHYSRSYLLSVGGVMSAAAMPGGGQTGADGVHAGARSLKWARRVTGQSAGRGLHPFGRLSATIEPHAYASCTLTGAASSTTPLVRAQRADGPSCRPSYPYSRAAHLPRSGRSCYALVTALPARSGSGCPNRREQGHRNRPHFGDRTRGGTA
jgi:hypothetical protein